MARVRKPSSDGWYIADFARREFLRDSGTGTHYHHYHEAGFIHTVWAPLRRNAKCYKGRLLAERRANEINAQEGGYVPPCSVVTAEAARCLDLIWMRERCRERGAVAGEIPA